MRYLISFFVFFIVLFFTIGFGGIPLGYLIDMPALLMMLLSVIPLLFVSGCGKDLLQSFSVIFRKSEKLSIKQLKRCKEALSLTIKLLLCSGMLFFLLPLIALAALDVQLSQLNAYIAVISLSALYAVFPCMLLLPIQAKISTQLIDSEKEE